MFAITQKYDEDIQDATYGYYKLVQLTINNEVVFSTADSDTLSRIAVDESGEGSWLIDADKNSQELGEFNQLRISKVGDVLKLEVQKHSNKEFEMIADIAISEFAAAVRHFIHANESAQKSSQEDGPLPVNADYASGQLLTRQQAFLVMSDFIWQFGQRAGDDLLTLIGDTTLETDGQPTDPAAWEDWLASVARIQSGRPPRS